LDYLKDNGIWMNSAMSASYKMYESAGFNTPSAKFEVSVQPLQQMGQIVLPNYVQIPDHEKLGERFVLVVFQSSLRQGDKAANCMWLAEIRHDNPLWINKSEAEKRGIAQGDWVRVNSPQGSLLVKAHLTNGIHPKVVAIERSLVHWAYGRIAQAMKFKSDNPNTQLIWWNENGHRVHSPLNDIVSVASDPIGGGQAWQDTLVNLTPASNEEAGERE
jgi:anaerobic selenocysteine-containing dehydrogenase